MGLILYAKFGEFVVVWFSDIKIGAFVVTIVGAGISSDTLDAFEGAVICKMLGAILVSVLGLYVETLARLVGIILDSCASSSDGAIDGAYTSEIDTCIIDTNKPEYVDAIVGLTVGAIVTLYVSAGLDVGVGGLVADVVGSTFDGCMFCSYICIIWTTQNENQGLPT